MAAVHNNGGNPQEPPAQAEQDTVFATNVKQLRMQRMLVQAMDVLAQGKLSVFLHDKDTGALRRCCNGFRRMEVVHLTYSCGDPLDVYINQLLVDDAMNSVQTVSIDNMWGRASDAAFENIYKWNNLASISLGFELLSPEDLFEPESKLNCVTDLSAGYLQRCAKLTSIRLNQCRFTERALMLLLDLHNLKDLRLQTCDVKVNGLDAINRKMKMFKQKKIRLRDSRLYSSKEDGHYVELSLADDQSRAEIEVGLTVTRRVRLFSMCWSPSSSCDCRLVEH